MSSRTPSEVSPKPTNQDTTFAQPGLEVFNKRREAILAKCEPMLARATAAFDSTDPDAYQSRLERRSELQALTRAASLSKAGRFNDALSIIGTDGIDPDLFQIDLQSPLSPGFPAETVAAEITSRRAAHVAKGAREQELYQTRRESDDRTLADPLTSQDQKDEIHRTRDIQEQSRDFYSDHPELSENRHSYFIGKINTAARLSLSVRAWDNNADSVELVCEERYYEERDIGEEGPGWHTNSIPLGNFASAGRAVAAAYALAPKLQLLARLVPADKEFSEFVHETGSASGGMHLDVDAICQELGVATADTPTSSGRSSIDSLNRSARSQKLTVRNGWAILVGNEVEQRLNTAKEAHVARSFISPKIYDSASSGQWRREKYREGFRIAHLTKSDEGWLVRGERPDDFSLIAAPRGRGDFRRALQVGAEWAGEDPAMRYVVCPIDSVPVDAIDRRVWEVVPGQPRSNEPGNMAWQNFWTGELCQPEPTGRCPRFNPPLYSNLAVLDASYVVRDISNHLVHSTNCLLIRSAAPEVGVSEPEEGPSGYQYPQAMRVDDSPFSYADVKQAVHKCGLELSRDDERNADRTEIHIVKPGPTGANEILMFDRPSAEYIVAGKLTRASDDDIDDIAFIMENSPVDVAKVDEALRYFPEPFKDIAYANMNVLQQFRRRVAPDQAPMAAHPQPGVESSGVNDQSLTR